MAPDPMIAVASEAWAFLGVVVTAVAGIVVAVVNVTITSRTRRENTSQHAASIEALNRVVEKVEGVDSKLDQHIGWHQAYTPEQEA